MGRPESAGSGLPGRCREPAAAIEAAAPAKAIEALLVPASSAGPQQGHWWRPGGGGRSGRVVPRRCRVRVVRRLAAGSPGRCHEPATVRAIEMAALAVMIEELPGLESSASPEQDLRAGGRRPALHQPDSAGSPPPACPRRLAATAGPARSRRPPPSPAAVLAATGPPLPARRHRPAAGSLVAPDRPTAHGPAWRRQSRRLSGLPSRGPPRLLAPPAATNMI